MKAGLSGDGRAVLEGLQRAGGNWSLEGRVQQGLGLGSGWFADKTRTCPCRPVHVAPVLNTLGKWCSLWSVLPEGCLGS